MISRSVTLLVVLTIATPAIAIDFNPFDGPAPIAVLIQTNPWLMVIGSDNPMIAIYENGDVVFLREQKDGPPRYYKKHLNDDELSIVTAKIQEMGPYGEVELFYDIAPGWTDQPETIVFLDMPDTSLITAVYGLKAKGTRVRATTKLESGEEPQQLPGSLERLHEYLSTLDFEGAEPWIPEFVEVMIWPYEYAPEESIIWPEEWPGIESGSSYQRGDSYSIFLPGESFDALVDFLQTRKERGAVEISGKKWAVSFRHTFPSEPVWGERLALAFQEASDE